MALSGWLTSDHRHSCAPASSENRVEVISRRELGACSHWQRAFASQHKDRRYYEIVEDTIHPEFEYRYFAIRNPEGHVTAIQPFFILDQDILAGIHPRFTPLIEAIRRRWPRFMRMKTMMVGCVAGEGHLDGETETDRGAAARSLAGAIAAHARMLGARLIVLKEFPEHDRDALSCFVRDGFTRIPSMPHTRLSIAYADFEDYMQSALNSATRRKLRKKFKATDDSEPITLSVTHDISAVVDEIFPLYLHVYERSKLRFERLTPQYFCRLGAEMGDRTRFFVWRRDDSVIAFGMCLVHGDTLFAEYLGLDYGVAFDLHLYHYVFRDLVRWGIANGYRWFQSTGLNYDPKLHLRQRLKPVDLYVRHTSALVNAVMRIALPLLEPTRHDETLKKFPNYADLWGAGSGAGKSSDGAPGASATAVADLRKGWGPS
ncbi:MAG: GNAT family N-acetyltransferase [Bradyrhizobiaceae bacterium]|nr:GNAT family N-acetyltransferase [Bradyrhizobiaceae bacterium]